MEQTCYRHPDRETGVSCSSCGRPICTDCMIPTSVGMRCPECAKQKTKVHTARSLSASDPQATYAIIALNVLAFLAQTFTGGGGLRASSGQIYSNGVLNGFDVNAGEWWRLISAGFLHADPVHLIFNMVGVYFLGQLLEPALGTARYLALYFGSLLAGSLGVLLLDPGVNTLGASGAVFGLLGAAFLIMRQRGVDPMRTYIGPLLIINILLSFRAGVSLGGHLGGLAGGLLCAWLIGATDRGRRSRELGTGACVAVGLVSFVAAIIASGTPSLYN